MARRFIWIASGLFVLMIAIDASNGRLWLNDLRVYWEASRHFLHGEAAYGTAFGLDSGFYKYAPIGLLVFAPIAALPFPVASVLFALLIAAAIVAGIVFADRLVRSQVLIGASFREAVLYLTVLVAAVHFHREIHLGNVNMILLVLLLAAIDRALHGGWMSAGALLGFVVLLKPHFVVLLPLLALHRRWREIAAFFLTVFLGVLLPILFMGWPEGKAIHREWLGAMATHNASVFYTGAGSRMATDTLFSVLRHLSLGTLPATTTCAVIIVSVVAAAIFALDRWLSRSHGDQRTFAFLALLLIAMVPSLTPTDTEHFLLGMPMIVLMLHAPFRKPRPAWLLPAIVIVLLAYGGNWQDPLGGFSTVLADSGVLGAANVALVILGTWIFAARELPAAA